MKMKFRIAAAAMAAMTAVCAAQATSISASAASDCTYTGTPQYACETLSHMMNHITMWSYSGEFRDGIYWSDATDKMYSGYVFGPGFNTSYNPSGIYKGYRITGQACLVRKLAESYFRTTIFCANTPNERYFTPQLGDQLKIKCGSEIKYVFVYQLPSSENNYKLKTVEVVNNRVRYNREYTSSTAYLYNGNQTWHIEAVTRPIKQGDANCDGVVLARSTYTSSNSDLDVINAGIPSNYTGDRKKAFIAAASLNDDRNVDVTDYRILLYNQMENGVITCPGRMNGYWTYLKTI